MTAIFIIAALIIPALIFRMGILPDNDAPGVHTSTIEASTIEAPNNQAPSNQAQSHQASSSETSSSKASNTIPTEPLTLFVLIHGLDRGKHWPSMQQVLRPHGDILQVRHDYPLLSNATPEALSRTIRRDIADQFRQKPYERVVLIGQSMGALLAKHCFLEAEQDHAPWAASVKRIVLVAGMNRGWDISGQKPSDMKFGTWFKLWFGSWLGRLIGFGNLILSSEAGTPFVANLRLDWIKRIANPNRQKIEVVQLLGDIDDLVSAEDNKDLRALGAGQFVWLKVRGTGHSNIVDFNDTTQAGDLRLGDYRREKFRLATTELNFDKLISDNEVLPSQPDPEVTHLIFVVHGIRDLGEWAATFEHEFKSQFHQLYKEDDKKKLQIASIRYGYFGMGPFLLKPVREKYVKWLMDEYTETLAQYPNLEQVHFVGHSNGTYLLATALKRYSSMSIGRIVFGGSVVRQDYPWQNILEHRDTHLGFSEPINQNPTDLRVTNYTAVDDWVVALFPRFFEPNWAMNLLNNDIGSAGFNGFTQLAPRTQSDSLLVKNVSGLQGGHAAFLSRIPQIARFILTGKEDAGPQPQPDAEPWYHALVKTLVKWGSTWATWLIVWPVLALIIIVTGWHVVMSASEPRWPFFLAYFAMILMILRNV